MERMGKPMKRVVVVGSAPFRDADRLRSFLREDDVLIAADGGLRLVQAMGKTPSMWIGDLDSATCPPDGAIACTVLPTHKDDTDVLAAVRAALADGYREFLLLGCLGGRLDHTVANVFVLQFLAQHDAVGCLADEQHEVTLLIEGTHTIPPRDGYHLSLFPYGGNACVSVSGAVYTLDHAVLDTAFPIGVSNAFSEETVTISVFEGALLCILAKD